MGSRGPLPQPTALRLLNGNPSGKPVNDSEPKPAAMATLEPPADLGPIARDVWARNAEELDRLGLLTTIDFEQFYRYCWVAERWHLAKQNLEKLGPVIPKLEADGKTLKGLLQNPYWYIERNYRADLCAMEQAFGMTPSARSRIRIDGGEGGGGARGRGTSGPNSDPFA